MITNTKHCTNNTDYKLHAHLERNPNKQPRLLLRYNHMDPILSRYSNPCRLLPFLLLFLHPNPMDDDADPNPSQRKTSLFLGCFGFSGKRKDSTKNIEDKVHHHRQSTFILKQSAGTKTVPLDSAASQKIQHKKINSMFNKSKLKKNAAGDIPLKSQITPAPVKPPQEARRSLEKKVNMIGNGKVLEKKKGHPSCRNESETFRRRIDSIRNACSQPGSPDTNSKSHRIPRSTSFSSPEKAGKDESEKTSRNNKLDAVMGMSIIMVTLVIILIWGRVCAIICTCTWLYFVPRLRKNANGDVLVNLPNGSVLEEPDFNSDEYKKRVVLEGFLLRNHNHNRSLV